MVSAAQGDDFGVSAGYLHQLRQQAQFRVAAGEIVVSSPQRNGQWESRTNGNGNDERLAFNTTGPHPSIQYERRTNIGEFRLTCDGGNEVTIQRSPIGTSTVTPLEFRQTGNGGVTLSFSGPEGKQTFQAPSLWHLLLAEPNACRRQLLPVLATFRERWELERQATDLEQILFRAVAQRKQSNDAVYAAWVRDLASDSFTVRAQADRKLRDAGQNALPYLQSLDRAKLDAEQRQRVRQIVSLLCGEGSDDHPERVATRLMADPRVWVALLDRDDVAKREAAAQRLAELAGRPIAFDPHAAPEVRQAQLEPLEREFARLPRK
jgi:hypothetical protein